MLFVRWHNLPDPELVWVEGRRDGISLVDSLKKGKKAGLEEETL